MCRRQVRRSDYLQVFSFRFRWQYKPGRINIADPLSRVQAALVAAVTRGQSKTAVPKEPATDPTTDPSRVLPSDPKTVLPQNLDTVADQQQPLTDFQQQVPKGYEGDSDCCRAM